MQQLETLNIDYGDLFIDHVSHYNTKKIKIKYKAALYLRLSREDNNGNSESMSIQSQREMLMSYAESKGYEVADVYIDDGYSGTNFDRPAFQRMIKDIKLSKINMVITKDLSRLGRNYILTGQYTDFFFPDNGVRFIAVNDDYDTNKDDNDIAPFRHILNEMYAKDISKKVRSSRKTAAKQGKFMGSIPPYGYKRSDTDRHKLVIDEISSKVVKRMYELFINGESARHIADKLNYEGLSNPQAYYYQRMGEENPYKKNAKTWSASTISNILKNQVYLGHIIQSKRTTQSFKSKKSIQLPPEMWMIAANTHEPIIDKKIWSEAQLLFAKRKNSKPKKTEESNSASLFSNLIFCKDCNCKMVFSSSKRKTFIDYYYRCSRYIQHGLTVCRPHRITLDFISQVVFEDIKNNARLIKEDEEAFIQNLYKINMKEQEIEINSMKKRDILIRHRQQEIDKLIQKSFEKNCSGVLPDNVLTNLLQGYEEEKNKLKNELEELKIKLFEIESQTKDILKELYKLKQYTEITKLDRKIVTSLIQSIHVSEPEKVDGEKIYDIEIRYKFQNPFKVKKEDTLSTK